VNARSEILKALRETTGRMGFSDVKINLERPADFKFGDYSTSIALSLAKTASKKPIDLAKEILAGLGEIKYIEKIEIAGAGFINFYLKREYLAEKILQFSNNRIEPEESAYSGKKVLVEYTDPNPFKVFHIGHLMSNAIGESISRIIAWHGANVERMAYQGDVGLHVAKAMWGILQTFSERPNPKSASVSEQIEYMGKAYVLGNTNYEENETAKKEIEDLNKKIFKKNDAEINAIYDWGKKVSLEHFEEIYAKLGTKFNHYIFESEVAGKGQKIVEENLCKVVSEGDAEIVFEKDNGAVVFKGEKYGLHTRVFINSQGLPTYETKEIGLNKLKFEKINPDLSIIVTANEQDAYFRVVLKAIGILFPEIAEKTRHISHGMLRFASGKMGSRKGNVITGESLIEKTEDLILERMADRDMDKAMKKQVASEVAVSALKYSILRQATGGDIIYDFDKSISFDGDSGPYLQYSGVRANSILRKAGEEGIKKGLLSGGEKIVDASGVSRENSSKELLLLERLVVRFPEVVSRSLESLEPHHLVTYLIELAGVFNSFYANNQIVVKDDASSPYKVALTESFKNTLETGLNLLGIKLPEKM